MQVSESFRRPQLAARAPSSLWSIRSPPYRPKCNVHSQIIRIRPLTAALNLPISPYQRRSHQTKSWVDRKDKPNLSQKKRHLPKPIKRWLPPVLSFSPNHLRVNVCRSLLTQSNTSTTLRAWSHWSSSVSKGMFSLRQWMSSQFNWDKRESKVCQHVATRRPTPTTVRICKTNHSSGAPSVLPSTAHANNSLSNRRWNYLAKCLPASHLSALKLATITELVTRVVLLSDSHWFASSAWRWIVRESSAKCAKRNNRNNHSMRACRPKSSRKLVQRCRKN